MISVIYAQILNERSIKVITKVYGCKQKLVKKVHIWYIFSLKMGCRVDEKSKLSLSSSKSHQGINISVPFCLANPRQPIFWTAQFDAAKFHHEFWKLLKSLCPNLKCNTTSPLKRKLRNTRRNVCHICWIFIAHWSIWNQLFTLGSEVSF